MNCIRYKYGRISYSTSQPSERVSDEGRARVSMFFKGCTCSTSLTQQRPLTADVIRRSVQTMMGVKKTKPCGSHYYHHSHFTRSRKRSEKAVGEAVDGTKSCEAFARNTIRRFQTEQRGPACVSCDILRNFSKVIDPVIHRQDGVQQMSNFNKYIFGLLPTQVIRMGLIKIIGNFPNMDISSKTYFL